MPQLSGIHVLPSPVVGRGTKSGKMETAGHGLCAGRWGFLAVGDQEMLGSGSVWPDAADVKLVSFAGAEEAASVSSRASARGRAAIFQGCPFK